MIDFDKAIEYGREDIDPAFGGGYTVRARLTLGVSKRITALADALLHSEAYDEHGDFVKNVLRHQIRNHIYEDIKAPFQKLLFAAMSNPTANTSEVLAARKEIESIIYG